VNYNNAVTVHAKKYDCGERGVTKPHAIQILESGKANGVLGLSATLAGGVGFRI
jgi:hypothetical protein